MDISDEELKKAILNSAPIPSCPSDKFVNSFISQMDKDLVANKGINFSSFALKAAAFAMILFGVSYVNRDFISNAVIENSVNANISSHSVAINGSNVSNKVATNKMSTLDNYYNNYANQYIDSYYNSDVSNQDAFISQAIGYEDISQIVRIDM